MPDHFQMVEAVQTHAVIVMQVRFRSQSQRPYQSHSLFYR